MRPDKPLYPTSRKVTSKNIGASANQATAFHSSGGNDIQSKSPDKIPVGTRLRAA